MSGWRAALRIARRSVRRSIGRSFLIAALIAVPVAGVTVADGIVRTMIDRDADLRRAMGIADLRVDVVDREPFDVEPLLPEGSRVVPLSTGYYQNSVRVVQGERIVRTRLDVVVLGDPMTAHIARVESGRLPKGDDEVLLTRSLAERLRVLDGDTVRAGTTLTTDTGASARVTGLAVEPSCLRCDGIVASPGSVIESAMHDGSLLPVGYLVDLPEGVDAVAVARGWSTGRADVLARESFVDGSPFAGYVGDALSGPVAILAGLGLVVVVVSAAAAFAVGARRQVRELGRVVAEGGDSRHVRRIVLAQGLVLGVLGAASGLVLGAAVTVLGVPLWERMTGQLLEDLRFGWRELAGIAVVGVIASVAAAAVPAFGMARMTPVDALAGRFRAAPPHTGFPVAGLLLATGGVACAVAAGLQGRDQPATDQALPFAGMVAGGLATVAGLVLVLPALLAAIGRLGTRLPLSGRLAVRDAVRHRHRTSVAVVAVTVTVAAVVVTAFVLAGRPEAKRGTPEHTMIAQLDPIGMYRVDGGQEQLRKAVADMDAAVPGTVAREVRLVTARQEGAGSAPILAAAHGSGAAPGCWSGMVATGAGLVDLYAGRAPDDGIRAALADGKAVVFDACLVGPSGTVTFTDNLPAPVELPAYLASRAPVHHDYFGMVPTTFVSEETAARLGWQTYSTTGVVAFPATATEDDIAALQAAADDAGVDAFVENTTDKAANLPFLLAVLAGLIALLGSGMVVALSAADGRSDLATLAALGAQPWRRRTIVGAQAFVVSGLGAAAGVVLGCGVGFAAVPVSGGAGFAVPWEPALLTGVAVPLVAVVVAMAVTPGRLPMIQRRQS